MITTNAEWDLKNQALGKKPIYVFSIGGESRVYTTHDLVREGVTGAPADYKPWLKTPRGASQSIDVLRGSSSIGELECEVVDQGGAVRQLVGSEVLEGRPAILSVGYPGIAYSHFVPLHTYQLYKITPSKTYTSWLFRSRDRQLALKRTVYNHPENGLPIEESNPWVLNGTPAEIVQAIYLFGLGRSDAELDRTTMLWLDSAAENIFHPCRPFQFVLDEAFEAKQFLETEIYKVCGMCPLVDNTGRISLRASRPPAAGAIGAFRFDEHNCTVLPEIDRMPVVNEIIFRIDREGSEFRNELVFVHGGSLSTYGRASQHVIESKGLRTAMGAQWFCQSVASRIFERFSGSQTLKGGAPVVRVEAFFMTLPVWVGDYVTLSHPLMPDITSGALGLEERVFEVIDREPDYSRGVMRYRLLDTGLTGREGARKFAPSDRDFVIGVSEVY